MGQLVLPVTPAEMCELSLATAGMVGTVLYFTTQVAKLHAEDSVMCNHTFFRRAVTMCRLGRVESQLSRIME